MVGPFDEHADLGGGAFLGVEDVGDFGVDLREALAQAEVERVHGAVAGGGGGVDAVLTRSVTVAEVWVSSRPVIFVVFRLVALRTGGHARVGRNRETVHAINWEPPFLGSQKSLIPDIWVEWEGVSLIVDAKYKRHWEELQQRSWRNLEEELREQHRNDLLQVLAYANLTRTPRVIACLAYPCSLQSWNSLRERDRVIHRAELTAGARAVHLWLTAVPMATDVERIAGGLADEIRGACSQG